MFWNSNIRNRWPCFSQAQKQSKMAENEDFDLNALLESMDDLEHSDAAHLVAKTLLPAGKVNLSSASGKLIYHKLESRGCVIGKPPAGHSYKESLMLFLEGLALDQGGNHGGNPLQEDDAATGGAHPDEVAKQLSALKKQRKTLKKDIKRLIATRERLLAEQKEQTHHRRPNQNSPGEGVNIMDRLGKRSKEIFAEGNEVPSPSLSGSDDSHDSDDECQPSFRGGLTGTRGSQRGQPKADEESLSRQLYVQTFRVSATGHRSVEDFVRANRRDLSTDSFYNAISIAQLADATVQEAIKAGKSEVDATKSDTLEKALVRLLQIYTAASTGDWELAQCFAPVPAFPSFLQLPASFQAQVIRNVKQRAQLKDMMGSSKRKRTVEKETQFKKRKKGKPVDKTAAPSGGLLVTTKLTSDSE